MFYFQPSRLAVSFALTQLSTVVFAQSFSQVTTTARLSASITGSASLPSGSGASSSASRSGAQVHTVAVGNGGFFFEPAELKDVGVGDTVTFEFYPPDHSVARAEFGSACVPYEYMNRGKGGFFSGQKFFDDPLHPIQWNITVNDTEPIFYYCTAPGSCIDKLMVGVINPTEDKTLQKQIEAAKNADFMVAPGDKIPSEGSATLHQPDATATADTAHGAENKGGHKLSGGAIAGIVIGAVAFLIVSAALFFYIGRAKSLKDIVKRNDEKAQPPPGAPGSEFGPGSPAYPPFSPHHNQADFSNLPRYSQHQATDSNVSGWPSPSMHPAHVSMMSQQHMGEVKPSPVEMASPDAGQAAFTAELEAPIKSPR